MSTNNGYEIRMSFYTNYLLEQNLIVKKSMPIAGIVCSNPRRAERIVSSHLTDANLLKEYHSAWQLDIYIGHYQGKMMFVAAIPVGAAGAAFAIQQFAVAGARYIVRCGSNDDPRLTDKRMDEVIIVDRADNLYGLMQGSGAPPETCECEWTPIACPIASISRICPLVRCMAERMSGSSFTNNSR